MFGWGLLLLGVLDIRHFWLPDRVTYPLALLGLSFGSLGAAPWLARIDEIGHERAAAP